MRLAFAALAPVVVAACGSFDSAAEAPPADAATADAASDGGASDGGASDCPGTQGPASVRVGTYCIDATEVTRAHYEAFLVAKGDDVSGQSSACATNSSYVPRRGWPPAPGEGDYPVIGVDWCDAYAYCQWAGKRLCGKIGGGPVGPSDAKDATKSQWFAACSKGGPRAFPYGQTYDANACNGGEAHPTDKRPRAVADAKACEGGYPGLFDMSGNAYEWEDACTSDSADAQCYIRGGDFNEPADTMGCGTAISQPRLGDGRWGFRCCSP